MVSLHELQNSFSHLDHKEISGTAGAFASTPLMKSLGAVYATITIPPLFLVGSVSSSANSVLHIPIEIKQIFYFSVQHNPPVRPAATDYQKRQSMVTNLPLYLL